MQNNILLKPTKIGVNLLNIFIYLFYLLEYLYSIFEQEDTKVLQSPVLPLKLRYFIRCFDCKLTSTHANKSCPHVVVIDPATLRICQKNLQFLSNDF